MVAVVLQFAALVVSAPFAAAPGDETITIIQLEQQAHEAAALRMACGPLSLWYCLRRTGVNVDAVELLSEFSDRKDGVSLRELIGAASRHGMEPRSIRVHDRSLARLPVPSILVIDDTHCVVFDGLEREGQALIFEPTSGVTGLERSELLSQRWTGDALAFRSPPTPPLTALCFGSMIGVAGTTLVDFASRRFRRQL